MPIGVDGDGPVVLDLVVDGPHALVGGKRNGFAAGFRAGFVAENLLHRDRHDFVIEAPGGLRGERLDDDCRTLAAAYPRPAPSTPAQWLAESWQMARRDGYPRSDESVPTISAQFNASASEIARQRVAQAGYRLAELLRELLGK